MSNDHRTIIKIPGARWAISRPITNAAGYLHTTLIEDSPLDHEGDAEVVIKALGLNLEDLDYYFPLNRRGQSCPTFELMKLWHESYFKGTKSSPCTNNLSVGV